MKFYATNEKSNCWVMTDDYDAEEIKNNLHIKNIIDDFKRLPLTKHISIFDENMNLVRQLAVV